MKTTKAQQDASKARIAAARAQAQQALANNHCPQCGNTVHTNYALTGWVQCDGFGAAGFRKAGHENDAACSWQGFTA